MATQNHLLAGYETTFICRSDISDDQLKALQEKLDRAIKDFGGDIVHQEDWGKKKLAYPIHKESKGHYTYVVYSGKGDVVHEVERNLRLSEHVIRFLTINLETEFDPEVYKKQRADQQAAAKRREEEKERRREERAKERAAYGGYGGGGYSDRSYGDDSGDDFSRAEE